MKSQVRDCFNICIKKCALFITFQYLFLCLIYDFFLARTSANTLKYFDIISLEKGLFKVK